MKFIHLQWQHWEVQVRDKPNTFRSFLSEQSAITYAKLLAQDINHLDDLSRIEINHLKRFDVLDLCAGPKDDFTYLG